MKLKVRGIESIVITDPNRHLSTRKHLDQALLQRIKGLAFTSAELKQMFGYAPLTALCDTQLARYVEPVGKIENPTVLFSWGPDHYFAGHHDEKSIRWRVK